MIQGKKYFEHIYNKFRTMTAISRLSIFCVTAMMTFSSCQDRVITSPGNTPAAVQPFDITDVTLLDGPFKHATDLNIESLLYYDPDRLLARFRIEAGLEPKAEPYGGWEAESLAGHSLGHHLSACALMYQTTGDIRFKERANYIVDELEEIQKANGGRDGGKRRQRRNRRGGGKKGNQGGKSNPNSPAMAT